MADAVLFAALGWEAGAALDALQGVEPVGPRRWRGYLGDGAEVRVLQVGIGLDRAERAVGEAGRAGLYLSCGCAGALVPGLSAGDLLVADRIVALDRSGRAVREFPLAAERLVRWSRARGVAVRVGSAASSPVVLPTRAAKRAAARHGALVVEMESAAVARAAAERGASCAVVKVVLDERDDAIGFPAVDAVDPATGDLDVVRGVRALVVRPHWWPRAVRLARRHRVAERRLREYLGVLFSAGLDALDPAPRPASTRAVGG
jgi:adenosylhomocysteine nucleosidase